MISNVRDNFYTPTHESELPGLVWFWLHYAEIKHTQPSTETRNQRPTRQLSATGAALVQVMVLAHVALRYNADRVLSDTYQSWFIHRVHEWKYHSRCTKSMSMSQCISYRTFGYSTSRTLCSIELRLNILEYTRIVGKIGKDIVLRWISVWLVRWVKRT